MNKKGILFTLIILIALLTLFSFVNRWAFVSEQYDEIDLLQEEFYHLYHLQNDLASTYLEFITIDTVSFEQNSSHTITRLDGNMQLKNYDVFMTDLYTFYDTQLQAKAPVFTLDSPLSSQIKLVPQGYNLTINQTTALLEWDENTSAQVIDIVLFFDTTILSVSNSQSDDGLSHPLINLTIYDENGLYDDYQNNLNINENNGELVFSSALSEVAFSFGLFDSSQGTLRIHQNSTVENLYVQSVLIQTPAVGEQYVGAFDVSYTGEYLSYDGALKLAYK